MQKRPHFSVSTAQSEYPGAPLEIQLTFGYQESCSLCEQAQPHEAMIIRHDETNKILCLACLAELNERE